MPTRGAAPLVLAGAAVVALVAMATALNVTAIVLDETVYKLAAAQYADGTLGENTSRGIARLYSLLISPLFLVFDGDVAVRLARALNTVLFAATAVPVWRIARRVVADDRAAAAAGVLAVAVPWVTVATIMFSEALAYLLFACTVLAMVRALERPSVLRDVLVLALLVALITTRVQFVALAPAWVLVVVLLGREGGVPWREVVRRRFPATAAAVALVALGGLVLLAAGELLPRLRRAAGPYAGLENRDVVSGDFGQALLWEVEMLAVGVGVLPALLAGVWARWALAGRVGPDARRLAGLALVALVALFLVTVFAQGGWLADRSEERYYVYAVPLLWIGAVAAAEQAVVRAGAIVAAGVALALVVLVVPPAVNLSSEQAVLGPVSAVVSYGLPQVEKELGELVGLQHLFTGKDLLGLLVVALTLGTAWLWARGRRAAAFVPAIAVQLFVAAFALWTMHGRVGDVPGVTEKASFADLGWIDRSTGGGPDVALLDNQADNRDGVQRSAAFWNDEVSSIARVPALGLPAPAFPVFTLPISDLAVAPDLTLQGDVPALAVTQPDSPLWQIAGERVRTAPDGTLDLVRPARPLRATWTAAGLTPDGQIPGNVAIRAAGGTRVAMRLVAAHPGQRSAARVELGGETEVFDTDDGRRRTLTFDLCDERGPVEGRIGQEVAATLEGSRFSAGQLVAVAVDPC